MTLLGDKNCAKLTIQWEPQRLGLAGSHGAPHRPEGINAIELLSESWEAAALADSF